jgi:hypothetical protein
MFTGQFSGGFVETSRPMQDAAPFIHEAILKEGILKIKRKNLPREAICCA